MTLTALQTMINSKVENNSFQRFSETQVISAINECLLELAINTDEYLVIEQLSTVIGQAVYSLPNTLSRLDRVGYKKDKIQVISFTELDLLVNNWALEDKADVLKYLVNQGSDIRIYPIPSKSYDISLIGKRLPDTVSDTTTILDMKDINANIVTYYVASTLLNLTGRTEDTARASQFYQVYMKLLKRLQQFSTNSTGKMLKANNGFR